MSEKEKQGPKAFEQAVAQNADKIQVALQRLQELEEQSSRISIQKEMLKFILLWILFSVVGLIFDVIRLSWNTATSSIVYGLNVMLSGRERDDSGDEIDNAKNRRKRMWRDRFNRFAPSVALALNPIPDIVRWSIQLSIFATLLSPLFNEIAASFGSHTTFSDIFQELKALHFGAMLRKMHEVLFS